MTAGGGMSAAGRGVEAGSRRVLVVSTLDTKGPEVAYVCDRLAALGATPVVVDAGILGGPVGVRPDVSREQVAEAAGTTLDAVRASGARGHAVEIMAEGLRALVSRMQADAGIQGGIGIGGLEGAVLATAALEELPFGVPKVAVSPIFSGVRRFGRFVGQSDIALLHSVADLQGLNSITRVILDRAARMVVAAWPPVRNGVSPLGRVGISLNGNTTAVGMTVLRELEERGHEVVTFHSNGVGGMSMERLAFEGELDAVIDLTTNELTEEIVGGLFPVRDRLVVAGRRPVPRVVVPGSLDFVCQDLAQPDPRFAARPTDHHNPEVVLVQITRDEATAVADAFVSRLLASAGPVSVVVPLRGVSLASSPGGVFASSGECGPLVAALLTACASRGLPVCPVDAPINDPLVGLAILRMFDRVTGSEARTA